MGSGIDPHWWSRRILIAWWQIRLVILQSTETLHQQFFRYGTGGELIINPGRSVQPFFWKESSARIFGPCMPFLEFDQMGLKISILDGWIMMQKNSNLLKISIFLIIKCIMKVWSMAFIIPTIMSYFMRLRERRSWSRNRCLVRGLFNSVTVDITTKTSIIRVVRVVCWQSSNGCHF